MKREKILFYLINDKIYIYLKNAEKDINQKLDTSDFFKLGEISNVDKGIDSINDFINKNNILSGMLKPDIYVLYNNNTNCDLKYLYKQILLPFNYNDCYFICLNDILDLIKKDDRIIVFDKNYYTVPKLSLKTDVIDNLDFEPIIIGCKNTSQLHFTDIDIIWNTFKTNFYKFEII